MSSRMSASETISAQFALIISTFSALFIENRNLAPGGATIASTPRTEDFVRGPMRQSADLMRDRLESLREVVAETMSEASLSDATEEDLLAELERRGTVVLCAMNADDFARAIDVSRDDLKAMATDIRTAVAESDLPAAIESVAWTAVHRAAPAKLGVRS